MNWSWMLPPNASTFGDQVDSMYYMILWVTGVVFVVTEALIVYFLFKYRHREGRVAEPIHGSTKAEVIWTTATFVLVVALALISADTWDLMKSEDRIPDNAMEINLSVRQFEWNATYAGADGAFETGDDFVIRNLLVVPVDQPIRINMVAEDVIHSLFLPEMRVKQDAVPGMEIPVWFEATQTGEFTIGCAELCGIGHTTMGGTLEVRSAADYQSWLNEQQAQAQD